MDEDLLELDKEFKLLTQKPGAVRAINKLHEKIQAEHSRRMTLSKAGSSLLNMIHHEENNDNPNPTPPANL